VSAPPRTVIRVSDSLRTTLRPKWLAVHAATAATVAGLVLIAQWQFRYEPPHESSLRHVTYAIELYVFALFVLAMWVKALRDARNKSTGPTDRVEAELQGILDGPVAYRRYVAPQMSSTPADMSDPLRRAYNDHLSRLAQLDEEAEGARA
jgi:hypothetical protein